MREDELRPGWVQARDILEELIRLQSARESSIELGRVIKVGQGLSRDVFAAAVSVHPDDNALSGCYAVLLPRSDAVHEADRAPCNELRLLAALHGRSLPFRVPQPLGRKPVKHGSALVRSYLRGIPLDLRAGRQPGLRPWQVVAEVASAVHAIDPATVFDPAHDHGTRRDHAAAAISVLAELDCSEAQAASAWAHEHLPPAQPASLLHGDLLGQNILLDPDAEPPYGVIDWEYARAGDPAYDLAIVTRGVRRPFQLADGLARLLDAYETASAGRLHVSREQVRVHELALAAEWYRDALERPREVNESADEARSRLRRVLRMATTTS